MQNNTTQTMPSTALSDTALKQGITLNIRQTGATAAGTLFRALVYHDGGQIADFTGTRNEVGKRLMSIIAERLFMAPDAPGGLLARLLGGTGGF